MKTTTYGGVNYLRFNVLESGKFLGGLNMVQKTKVVPLSMGAKEEIAREIAHEVLNRTNPHQHTLIDDKLTAENINEGTLTKYFQELTKVVAEFWRSQYDVNFRTTLKPHEVRQLYLPLIYSVILSSVGNLKSGNYEYRITTVDENKVDEKSTTSSPVTSSVSIDKEFVIETSARLESLRDYIAGDIGQIGNRNAIPQTSVMLTLLGNVDLSMKTCELEVRDGASVDEMLGAYAALVGLSLKESANSILYTGMDLVNFREVVSGIVQRNSDKVD